METEKFNVLVLPDNLSTDLLLIDELQRNIKTLLDHQCNNPNCEAEEIKKQFLYNVKYT